jgi:hypothetical protein
VLPACILLIYDSGIPSNEKTFWAHVNGRCRIMLYLRFVILVGIVKDLVCVSGGTSLY